MCINMEKLKNIILVAFFAVFVASLLLNVYHYTDGTEKPYCDTIRTTLVDTISYYKPILKDSTVTKYVTVRVPVADDKEVNFPNKTGGKENNLPTKDDHFEDKDEMVAADSVAVQIPITQKVYEDSTYTAYISGYRPSLDSLILRSPREIVIIKEKTKPKRWGVGVQVGYGIELKGTPQFAPYVGVGVSYNLFNF